MLMICSGFSPSGYRQYGRRFLDSFDRCWPADVKLGVWVEEPVPMPRDACRDLWAIPGATEFRDRHAGNAAAQGREPRPCWKAAEVKGGYSFRTDAYKFWKQILIPQQASLELADGDVLAWFDADVQFSRPVPADFVEKLLGDADVCFLGRERQHSEIGFWAVRLNESTRWFLSRIANEYVHDKVFDLVEWHSAFVWDHVRRTSHLRERNLTPGPVRGHVWPLSPLARYCEHLKGARKGVSA
jgi:hypothetical protein